jgi:hypothetical protein
MGARATALAVVACLAVPGAARAARVEVSASTGPASEEFILYRAGKGESNRVRVKIARRSITIVDRGVRRIGLRRRRNFTNCRRTGRRRVVCPRRNVQVVLRDKSDKVSFTPGTDSPDVDHADPLALADRYGDTEGAFLEATDVNGGSGKDIITGSRYSDVITPGPGRDRVNGRGGNDDIYLAPDGRKDSIRGGGGIDGIAYTAEVPVTVDLAAGTAGPPGDTDRIQGIEQVHGGPMDDVLLGSGNADALYGEAGSDQIDGRGGNDLLVGDSPGASRPFANQITGGPGDDIVDARSQIGPNPASSLAPTTTVDCGAGNDREAGEVDDLLDPSCEAAAFRIPLDFLFLEQPLYDVPMKVAPVARAADGSPTFEVPCPAITFPPSSGCNGTVAVERPPVAGSSAPAEKLGSGSFNLTPGQRANVMVQLTPAGQTAVASGSPVAVHVTATLPPPAGSPPGQTPSKADFGWQAVLGP